MAVVLDDATLYFVRTPWLQPFCVGRRLAREAIIARDDVMLSACAFTVEESVLEMLF